MAGRHHHDTRRAFRRTALALALGLGFVGAVQAQSVTGSIYGNTGGGGGTVVIRNLDTGATQSLTPDTDGRYNATTVPSGRYRVSLERDGAEVSSREVRVVVGQGSAANFGGSDGDASTLAAVTVVGTAISGVDVSTVESKLVVTKELLDRIPIAPNLTAIAMLAPGVVQGDSRYGNIPTFSGSSASENAYYINGFPVTQALLQIGYNEPPFNSIDQVQVSTGGYSVEYGRATGGVTSMITSKGTNEWEAGGQYVYRPEGWKSDPRDIVYGPNGRSGLPWGNEGQIYQYRKENKTDYQSLSTYVGGPIVRDHLFFFAAGEFIREDGGGTNAAASSAAAVNTARTNGWTEYETELPRWLGRIDWNITDNHLLSFTGLQDRRREYDERSGFDYATLQRVGDVVSTYERDRNTRIYIGNYTGYLTEDLTVSAMVGESKTEYEGGPGGYNPDCPAITVNVGSQVPGLNYTTCQFAPSAAYLDGRFDKSESWRLDVEYQIGDHAVKVGYDYLENTGYVGASNDGLAFPGALGVGFPGGFGWSFFRAADPNEPIYQPQGVGSPASGGGNGLLGYYAVRNVSNNLSSPRAEQKAQYIKDVWQLTDDVILELGLRNEEFYNYASDGVAYLEKDRQLAPRFGVTWDVNGDQSTKVFASAGRYHLAVPNNVARRGVDGATNTSEAFVYTGIDPVTGAPTGLTALGPVYSPNNEFGQSRDGRTISPTSLKSHYQDTLAFGIEKDFDGFIGGAKYTYSELGSAIDDFCDARPIAAWGAANGYSREELGFRYDPDSEVWVADEGVAYHFGHCVLINPGENNTYRYDIDGDGDFERIELTKEMLGFPSLVRKYSALDLFVERPFDGTWYGRIDYTLSKSYGNMEGQLNSDIGQVDVSVTLAGDYYEMAHYAYGDLPNDRRHQLKANGFWQIAPEWTISGMLQYASGRPMNCRGAYPNIDPESPNYGSYHFFCNGQPAPRGTYGRLPDFYRLDLGARYSPQWADGLSLGLNVYNVTDRQSVANINELYNQGASATTINANWNRVQSYTTPRYAEFVVRYDWGGGKD